MWYGPHLKILPFSLRTNVSPFRGHTLSLILMLRLMAMIILLISMFLILFFILVFIIRISSLSAKVLRSLVDNRWLLSIWVRIIWLWLMLKISEKLLQIFSSILIFILILNSIFVQIKFHVKTLLKCSVRFIILSVNIMKLLMKPIGG